MRATLKAKEPYAIRLRRSVLHAREALTKDSAFPNKIDYLEVHPRILR